MTEKDGSLSAYDEIGKIVRPIFNKVLQETTPNHTMVGNHGSNDKTPSLYNPHNYRLYFAFKKDTYKPLEGMVGVWFGKFKNYGKEFTSTGEGVRITVKKSQVEVINKLSDQHWYMINRFKAKEEVSALLNEINKKCIIALKKFIEVYGGESDYIILNNDNRANLILNTKCDNKVMRDKIIDSLPLNMTFETEIVKKVYKQPNVEFKEPVLAARYLENSALNEFSPEITQALKELYFVSDMHKKAFEEYAACLAKHLKVLDHMDKTLTRIDKAHTRQHINKKEQTLRKWL